MNEFGADEQAIINKRKETVEFINKNYHVSDTVNHLNKLMHDVTKEEVTADSVNAACNCVNSLNDTIRVAMQAARFVSGK